MAARDKRRYAMEMIQMKSQEEEDKRIVAPIHPEIRDPTGADPNLRSITQDRCEQPAGRATLRCTGNGYNSEAVNYANDTNTGTQPKMHQESPRLELVRLLQTPHVAEMLVAALLGESQRPLRQSHQAFQNNLDLHENPTQDFEPLNDVDIRNTFDNDDLGFLENLFNIRH